MATYKRDRNKPSERVHISPRQGLKIARAELRKSASREGWSPQQQEEATQLLKSYFLSNHAAPLHPSEQAIRKARELYAMVSIVNSLPGTLPGHHTDWFARYTSRARGLRKYRYARSKLRQEGKL